MTFQVLCAPGVTSALLSVSSNWQQFSDCAGSCYSNSVKTNCGQAWCPQLAQRGGQKASPTHTAPEPSSALLFYSTSRGQCIPEPRSGVSIPALLMKTPGDRTCSPVLTGVVTLRSKTSGKEELTM